MNKPRQTAGLQIGILSDFDKQSREQDRIEHKQEVNREFLEVNKLKEPLNKNECIMETVKTLVQLTIADAEHIRDIKEILGDSESRKIYTEVETYVSMIFDTIDRAKEQIHLKKENKKQINF